LKGHTKAVFSLAVGADGTVYSAGHDSSIRVWSGIDGSSLRVLGGHPGAVVWALAIAADGTLFSGASDSTLRVWSDGEHIRTLIGHTGLVSALAIGTHGKLYSAESGSWDTTVRVWSVADGTHLSTLEGHTGAVVALAVGLDGTVYSGSGDTTIRAWSGEDGRLLRTLLGHTSAVQSLVIGVDGTLFSGSANKTVRVWCGGTGGARYILPVDSDGGRGTCRWPKRQAVRRCSWRSDRRLVGSHRTNQPLIHRTLSTFTDWLKSCGIA
jgi:WD40 repeat protein